MGAEMTEGSIRHLRHTAAFVRSFRSALQDTYGWRSVGEAVEVRDVLGRRTVSHLPHLGYSDLHPSEARALAESLAGRPYILRVLDAGLTHLEAGDPVTMRIPLGPIDDDGLETRFRQDRMTRANLNRAARSGLVTSHGTRRAEVDAFVGGLARSLHRIGSPMIPREVVVQLLRHLDAEVLITWSAGLPIAGMLLLHDEGFTWTPWLFTRLGDSVRGAGETLFLEAARLSCSRDAEFLDLGRSPLGSSAFAFKARFGAVPVPIALLRSGVADPYRFAGTPQSIWRRIPGPIADRFGPALCRHLPEY